VIVDGVGAAAVGDRSLVEEIVRLLLAGAPPGWTHLHGEFTPPGQSAMAGASLTTSAGPESVAVSADVLAVVAEHQRRAAVAGVPWARLIIDCSADGGLSARTEPAAPAPVVAAAEATSRRWQRRVLVTASAVFVAAAVVVFAVGWQWSTPPRAGIIAVPPSPPREQAAWSAITKWVDAENRSDTAELRRMVCANPSPRLAALIKTFEVEGNIQRLSLPSAIVKFDDEGASVSATVEHRVRPLSDAAKKQIVSPDGLYETDFTLADEAGELKVCDESGITHR
jgi:hypothetical protein